MIIIYCCILILGNLWFYEIMYVVLWGLLYYVVGNYDCKGKVYMNSLVVLEVFVFCFVYVG